MICNEIATFLKHSFEISLESGHLIVPETSLSADLNEGSLQFLAKYPRIWKIPAKIEPTSTPSVPNSAISHLSSSTPLASASFPLGIWFIEMFPDAIRTQFPDLLMRSLCNNSSISAIADLESYFEEAAYCCNLIRLSGKDLFEPILQQHYPLLSNSLKSLFLRKLPHFTTNHNAVLPLLLDNWNRIEEQGREEMALASLEALLAYRGGIRDSTRFSNDAATGVTNESSSIGSALGNFVESLHDHSGRLEILSESGSLKLLADLVFAFPGKVQICSIFRDRLVKLESKDHCERKAGYNNSKVKKPRLATDYTEWLANWSRVIQRLQGPLSGWLFTPTTVTLIDLLTRLGDVVKFKTRGLLREFFQLILDGPPDIVMCFIESFLPEVFSKLQWLQDGIIEVLLSLFSFLTSTINIENSNTEPSSEAIQQRNILNGLFRAFLSCAFGITGRRSFLALLSRQIESSQDSSSPSSAVKILELLKHVLMAPETSDARYLCWNSLKAILEEGGVFEDSSSSGLSLLRAFYSTFAMMASLSPSISNELMLVLKKQTNSLNPHYQRLGARGTAILISTLGKAGQSVGIGQEEDDLFGMASCSQAISQVSIVNPEDGGVSTHQLSLLISLLEETVSVLKQAPDQVAFFIFLKELRKSFSILAWKLKEWIGEWSMAAFQESCIVSITEEGSDEERILELNSEVTIAIKLSGGCVSSLLLSLLSYWELEQSEDGSCGLESIDSLQVCGFLNPKGSNVVLWHIEVMNCLRTILNIFSAQASTSATEANQIARLRNLVDFHRHLRKHLKSATTSLKLYRSETDDPLGFALEERKLIENDSAINEDSHSSNHSRLDQLSSTARGLKFSLLKDSSLYTSDPSPSLLESHFQPLTLDFIKKASSTKSFMEELETEEKQFLLRELEIFHQNSQEFIGDLIVKLAFNSDGFALGKNDFEGIVGMLSGGNDFSSHSQTLLLQFATRELSTYAASGACTVSITDLFDLAFDIIALDTIPEVQAMLLRSLKGENSRKIKLNHWKCLIKHCEFYPLVKEIIDDVNQAKNEAFLRLPKNFVKAIFQELTERIAQEPEEKFSPQRHFDAFSLLTELIQMLRFSDEGAQETFALLIREARQLFEAWLSSPTLRLIEQEGLLTDQQARPEILAVFRQIQQSTRALQIICSHLKYAQESEISNSAADPSINAAASASTLSAVPALKKTLEAVIFRVKEVISRSGCLNAFWIGNLKHRALDGTEVSSQIEFNKDDEQDHTADSLEAAESDLEDYLSDYDALHACIEDLIKDSQ